MAQHIEVASVEKQSAAIARCIKANDVRGRFPDELNSRVANEISKRYAARYSPKRAVVGWDVRLSSPEIAEGIIDGLRSQGVDVYCLGQVATELVYFAAQFLSRKGVEVGFMVTASHNPKEYNGIKIVGPNAKPFYVENGLEKLSIPVTAHPSDRPGTFLKYDILPHYLAFLSGQVDFDALNGLTILFNSGNGCAGQLISAIAQKYRLDIVHINELGDGHFPNGVPNPLLTVCRKSTAKKIQDYDVDFGVAFDGDADRCFFFDHSGDFIESY